jgi:peptide/nickel transport system permease protein
MAGALRLIVFRLVGGCVTLLIASVFVFAATEVLPGDPAQLVLGKQATPASLKALRSELGLDRSLPAQYLDWLQGASHLDFGYSLTTNLFQQPSSDGEVHGTPVLGLIKGNLKNSAILGGVTLLILVPLSFAIGTAAAVRQGSKFDSAMQVVTLALTSLPEFVLGVVLVLLFSVSWAVLPAVSFQPGPSTLVLPVATLLAVSVAYTSRMIRAGVIEVLNSDYVRVARLKGIPERQVLMRHVLPNAIGPALQAFALTIGWLAGGLVVVEAVFAYPGVGQGIVQAVSTRDLPTVQAYTLVIATVYVVGNLLVDLLTNLADPRVRLQA